MSNRKSEIKSCKNGKCVSSFQDKRYGKGMRVMNPKVKPDDTGYSCTVCGTVQ